MPADIPDEVVEVFPDSWDSFRVFEAMGTQWRSGACGATGLDYSVLASVMGLLQIRRGKRTTIFHDLRVMEDEALAIMAESRD